MASGLRHRTGLCLIVAIVLIWVISTEVTQGCSREAPRPSSSSRRLHWGAHQRCIAAPAANKLNSSPMATRPSGHGTWPTLTFSSISLFPLLAILPMRIIFAAVASSERLKGV